MEKIKMIVSMLIVGTIGIFVNFLPFSSSIIACARAVIGSIFLFLVILISKSRLHGDKIKKNAVALFVSGAAIGFNWIFLFEAYRYTTVAVATLCYYMAPVFVILLSPIILKERLTKKNIVCTIGAVVGAFFISGVMKGKVDDIRGIVFGLLAAVLYCSIILLNKKIQGLEAMETTFCQLLTAAVVMVPYVLIKGEVRELQFSSTSIVLLLVVGIVHTGIAYVLLFSAIGKLPAQTSSVLSYVDPITAIILSSMLLQQSLTVTQMVGTVLILGFTLLNEVEIRKFSRTQSAKCG